jgi:NAD(P)-dependent dehydrogenase (short-subunit alcohol dehydrogenase family)
MRLNEPGNRRLEGRVALVTGGGSRQGIGRSISLRLAQEGARVAVLDIDESGARRLADEIVAAGGEALGAACDVTQLDQCLAAGEQAAAAWGRLDILVNNAALLEGVSWGPFDELDVTEWDRMLNVNLRGQWFCARAVAPHMKRQGYGKIINLASSTFMEGVAGFVHYTSSKGGVIGLTRALGRELGEFGIRVNALAPGYTLSQAQAEHASAHPEWAERMRSRQALGRRNLVPEDLAGPAFFLASPDSDWMTCQTILVDGGQSMW